MPRRIRRKFSAEEKADAGRMVHQVGNLAKVARADCLTQLRSAVSVSQRLTGDWFRGRRSRESRDGTVERREVSRTLRPRTPPVPRGTEGR